MNPVLHIDVALTILGVGLFSMSILSSLVQFRWGLGHLLGCLTGTLIFSLSALTFTA